MSENPTLPQGLPRVSPDPLRMRTPNQKGKAHFLKLPSDIVDIVDIGSD